jgi:MFS family permease
MLMSIFTFGSIWNIPVIIFLLFMIQVSISASLGPYGGLIPDLIEEKHQGMANGAQGFGNALATLAASATCALLMEVVPGGWKYVVTYGAACLVFLITSTYTVIGLREKYVPKEKTPFNCKQSIIKVAKKFYFPIKIYYRFFIVSFCTFLLFLGLNMLSPFIQYFIKDVLQYENEIVFTAIVMFIFVLGSATGGVFGGVMSDIIGPKIVLFFGLLFLLMGYGIYLFVIAFIHHQIVSGILLAGSFICVGLGFGSSVASINTITMRVIPESNTARDLAVGSQFLLIADTVGSLVGGQLLAWLKGYSIRLAYGVLIGIGIVMYIICGFLMLCVTLNKKKKKVEPVQENSIITKRESQTIQTSEELKDIEVEETNEETKEVNENIKEETNVVVEDTAVIQPTDEINQTSVEEIPSEEGIIQVEN